VRIDVSSTCVPILDRGSVSAADCTAARSRQAETVRIPFSPAGPNLSQQTLAPRLLDPVGSSGERIDRLITVGRGHRIESLTL
jgi:hypothetical protein